MTANHRSLVRLAAAALLTLALGLAGCGRRGPADGNAAPGDAAPRSTEAEAADKVPTPAPAVEDLQAAVVSVWFANQDLDHLVAEARDVATDPAQPAVTAKAALEALLDGPKEEGHSRVIPEGTTVRSVQVASSLATVDLSREFVDKFSGGTMVAHLAVYSVVNTVTGIEGIERVQILVDGKAVEEFAGAEVLKDPLEPDTELTGGEKL